MAFVDIFDLAGYLDQEVSDLGWLGEFAVRAASETVEGVLGHSIGLVEDDEITLDGSGIDALVLPITPVVDVSAVAVGDVALVEVDDFLVGSAGVLYRVDAVWTLGRLNVAVTYSHGWSEIGSGNAVPMDIREAALWYAREVFQAGSAPATGMASETLGAASYTVSAASTAAAAAMTLMGELRAKLHRHISQRVG